MRHIRPLRAAAAVLLSTALPALAEDPLLHEAIELPAAVLYLDSRVPGLVMGVIRNGETAVIGFGETARGSGKVPDGDTMMRIGSITKVFTGAVLASLVADGTVAFTDPLQEHLDWGITVPARDGHVIRLIDLVTHTSGLPREVEREAGPPDDPFATLTEETYAKGLAADPLLFPPGTGGLYSNFAFDVLSAALGNAAGKAYADALRERVIDPAGLKDTVLTLRPGDEGRLMQGHNFDGSPMPNVPATPIMAGASSLYSTPNDILRWLGWHMDRLSTADAEMRLLDHAAYVFRDDLSPVLGYDESGHMDAVGLGWIIMEAEGGRPLILQKAGGLQGMFVYCAFAPSRNVGAFVAINEFNFATAMEMATVVNDLIATLAPR
ncbi:MAG TPA: D-alanyl-D-alanine-carboxypeptidase/endopeptidase AmpH [Bauldia sp.]|nr:D-alanyl-D-alanine-carboxypeptidase/endopeptidase AmpH [Bauldia sp.]